MTKQEEIREGIADLPMMDSDSCEYARCQEYADDCRHCRADAVLEYLHSQGVVIKVEGELPPNKMACNMRVIGEPEATKQIQDEIRREMEIYSQAQQDMLNAGYEAVEPLIEE